MRQIAMVAKAMGIEFCVNFFPLNEKRIGIEEWVSDTVCLFDFYGLAFGFLFFLFGDSDV